VTPQFTLIAGPNGSGKSTLTSAGSTFLQNFPILDPDAIARIIQVNAKASSALAAGRQALNEAEFYLQAGRSFAVETTLSGHNYMQMMVDARERGFDVILVYVGTTDPAINVARVARRVALGGHAVPETDIRRRYERSLKNLPLAVSRADTSILFDNSTGRGYELVAIFEAGKTQWFQSAPEWAAALTAQG
jgi:predicted ABC-type ATPase